MGAPRGERTAQASSRTLERRWVNSETGLILMAPSLTPIACNWDAASILNYPERPTANESFRLQIPEEILTDLRLRGPAGPSCIITHFMAGRRQYVCQANVLNPCSEVSQGNSVVLLLRRHAAGPEAIHKVAAQFNLTEREREALEGVSMGLNSKQLAERMKISPNTVKSYLHLIMVKMGTATRAGIVAKILEHNRGPGGSGNAVLIGSSKPYSNAVLK